MIAHFASELSGGANIAARRLHEALRKSGVESYFFHGTGIPPDKSYISLFENKSFIRRNQAALATSWRSRMGCSEGFVTSPRWIRKTPIQESGKYPAIVNLHWVARWLDLPSFFASLPDNIPVVWSLHDLIPITGGCHYPGECDGFMKQCGDCPQQRYPHAFDASRTFFNIKKDWYDRINLHFVANSRWTAAQTNRSALGKLAKSVHVIHYGLDVQQYIPVDRTIAKAALKIPEGKFVIGFSCSDFHEKRKGAHLLLEALKDLPSDNVMLLVLGGGNWPRDQGRFETISLGSLNTPRLQSIFYSALDVFAAPSKVETFGNVAMEAMACATPVVAYSAGGLADVLVNGETGLVEPECGNIKKFAAMLKWMSQHSSERILMGRAARERVLMKFTDTRMASEYQKLYYDISKATALEKE